MKFLTPHNRIASDLWANSRLRTITRLTAPHSQTVLDLGCGPGYFGQTLAENGNDVYYVDISDDELAKIDAPANRKFRLDATQPLPFDPAMFDWIFCGDLLEHLEDDTPTLANIHRLLKPGGRAAIAVPAHSRLYGHHDQLVGHHRRYDAAPFAQQLVRQGFDVVHHRYLCSLLLFPFLANQWLFKNATPYQHPSRFEQPLRPLLHIFAEIDSRVRLPFGIGLMFIVQKFRKAHYDAP